MEIFFLIYTQFSQKQNFLKLYYSSLVKKLTLFSQKDVKQLLICRNIAEQSKTCQTALNLLLKKRLCLKYVCGHSRDKPIKKQSKNTFVSLQD